VTLILHVRNNADAMIGLGQHSGDCNRVIGRCVVDNQHPQIAGGLLKRALYADSKVPAIIVAWDDNVNSGHSNQAPTENSMTPVLGIRPYF
jgi:hypothetical protein